MEDNGNKGKKFSYMNSVSSHQADQNLSYLTCLSSEEEDERNKLPKTSFFLTSFSSFFSEEDQEKQTEKMANFNQENEETLKQTNDSLRKEHLEEGDTVEIRRKEHASKKEHSHNEWVIHIKKFIINNQWYPSIRRCCIYRAHTLRDVDIAAFTPKVVSIGPLHYFDEHLKGMEATKIKFLGGFLQHADKTARLKEQLGLTSLEERLEFLCWKDIDQMETANDDFSCLDNFLSLLESLEKEIRSSYAENLNHIASEDFLRLILVDAAFIIELFLKVHFKSKDDILASKFFLLVLIRCDLWLLENQLPFFVLQELYHTAFGSYPDIYPPFLELTFNYFGPYNHQGKKPKAELNHFTDLLRIFFLPSAGKFQENEQNITEDELKVSSRMFGTFEPSFEHLPSATQLHATGVKFSASQSKCFLDIKFSNGRLEIPFLHLFDRTVVLFRNLIALEQYHYPEAPLISNYFTFMDYLVDTSNDADLLVGKKIIKHWLGSGKEVTNLFNSLCVGIAKGAINEHFNHLIKKLNEYHDQPSHRRKATLKNQYFSTPWRSASTIAAIILLALTLAQTILSGIAFSLKA